MDKIEKKLNGNILVDNDEPNSETIHINNIPVGLSNLNPINERKEILKIAATKRPPSCGLIVIDNFYSNAIDTRNYILTQDFFVKGNYPGQRTTSYANEHLKEVIQKYVEPFAGKITDFPIPKADMSDAATIYNGSFQYTTSRDRSWVHVDNWNNWAGVLFLTPDAPVTAGTAFYRFHDGTSIHDDNKLLDNKNETDTCSQDLTKWELVDRAGNIFNRLILFNAHRYHMSMDYFGDCKENGRLFQVFFFSTER
jgi:hypothetical protein